MTILEILGMIACGICAANIIVGWVRTGTFGVVAQVNKLQNAPKLKVGSISDPYLTSTVAKSSETVHDPAAPIHSLHVEVCSVDEAKSGQVLTDIPNYNPTPTSGWKANRTVLATAVATLKTATGTSSNLFMWLSGDMLILKSKTMWRLLTTLSITSKENTFLVGERKRILDSATSGGQIEEALRKFVFRGCTWRLATAYGKNLSGSNAGYSTIECTSVIKNPGTEFADDLPSKMVLSMGKPVRYYDMRLEWLDGDPSFKDRFLVVIWPEESGDCMAYVGKELSPAEVAAIGVQ